MSEPKGIGCWVSGVGVGINRRAAISGQSAVGSKGIADCGGVWVGGHLSAILNDGLGERLAFDFYWREPFTRLPGRWIDVRY